MTRFEKLRAMLLGAVMSLAFVAEARADYIYTFETRAGNYQFLATDFLQPDSLARVQPLNFVESGAQRGEALVYTQTRNFLLYRNQINGGLFYESTGFSFPIELPRSVGTFIGEQTLLFSFDPNLTVNSTGDRLTISSAQNVPEPASLALLGTGLLGLGLVRRRPAWKGERGTPKDAPASPNGQLYSWSDNRSDDARR